MIRSSKHTIKFANINKKKKINIFIYNYKQMVKKYINIIWNEHLQNLPSLLDNDICKIISTNSEYDSRIRQCAAKQACSMIKAIFIKHNKRLYKLKQLQKEGNNTKYLQRKINLFKPKKPNCNNINVELDSRFVNIQKNNGHFDLFIKISQIGNKENIIIPIKHTKVSNHWLSQGQLKNSIRLNQNTISLYYEVKDKENIGNKIIGGDQGQITCLSLSDGQQTGKCNHGHDLNSIQDKLTRKKKGSKGFKKTQKHRENYINWSIKQLNFDNVKELRLEKIVNIRKGRKSSRKMSHWTYPLIKKKLIMISENKGFIFIEQDNKYRSQRCSSCGWTHKSNRKGKTFKCTNTICNFIADSDLNAASNHETELCDLGHEIWQKHINHNIGFFWYCDKYVLGKEPIVPCVQKE